MKLWKSKSEAFKEEMEANERFDVKAKYTDHREVHEVATWHFSSKADLVAAANEYSAAIDQGSFTDRPNAVGKTPILQKYGRFLNDVKKQFYEPLVTNSFIHGYYSSGNRMQGKEPYSQVGPISQEEKEQSVSDPMRYFGKEHEVDRPNFRKPEAAPEFVPSHRTLEDIENKKLGDLRVAQKTLYDRRAHNPRDPFTQEMNLGDDVQKADGEKRVAFENRQPELGRTGEWSSECLGVADEHDCRWSDETAAELARLHFISPADALAAHDAFERNGEGYRWSEFEDAFKAQNNDPGLSVWFDVSNCELHAHHERTKAKEAEIEGHFSRQGREGDRSM